MVALGDGLIRELTGLGLSLARRRVRLTAALIDPEDMVQEALIALLCYRGEPDNVYALFATMIRYQITAELRLRGDVLRGWARRRTLPLDRPLGAGDGDTATLAAILAAHDADLGDAADAAAAIDRVLAVARDRETVAMALYAACGYTLAEIGRRYGLRAGHVSTRLRRFRASPEGRALRAHWQAPPVDRAGVQADRARRAGTMRHRGGIAARHAARTHCPRGHPYDEGNTYRRADGSRACRRCARRGRRGVASRR